MTAAQEAPCRFACAGPYSGLCIGDKVERLWSTTSCCAALCAYYVFSETTIVTISVTENSPCPNIVEESIPLGFVSAEHVELTDFGN
ncbi:hypothetical protein GCK32_019316 [Trichostrongylus colubriformis]|uniref:Uncharacterized protein n=1 Tax=Trichostrongylus colubriformis TaxID=6319 RepID=A0AAN8IJJ6_TRICO